jgi:hypothetical protein
VAAGTMPDASSTCKARPAAGSAVASFTRLCRGLIAMPPRSQA